MDDRRVLSVSELNAAIRTLLEGRYPFVSVCGEVSNLAVPMSGHCYFTLKDADAQLRAVLFKQQQRYLERPLKDGDHVVCRGRISVYAPRGEYQLIVDVAELQGTGALQQAFDRLKRRLAEEGLFDEHRKRPLPALPEHITLITSPRGAAVHDFIRIATRRWPGIRIAVWPAPVQGEHAAEALCAALAEVSEQVATDVVVLCRGGGSPEDLWAFNDEHLARAIRASSVPVVSAVGHEIDVTIADFAADLRAPTPSAAAELLTPDSAVLRDRIDLHRRRLERAQRIRLDRLSQRLHLVRRQLETVAHPLERLSQRLDHLSLQLVASLQARLADRRRRLDRVVSILNLHTPTHKLALHQRRLEGLGRRLAAAIGLRLQRCEQQFVRAAGILHAVSPLATLARGYAIVRAVPSKRVVSASSQTAPGSRVEVLLHRGSLLCRVEEAHPEKPGTAISQAGNPPPD
ncbi:MAG: exodeoxyribonuclease VII large subunit [Desulfobulbus sp.]|jgi:exodeoxyribonuclease VII large subunit